MRGMKMTNRIGLAALVFALSTGSTVAAEINSTECAAIRELVKSLAQVNSDSAEARLATSKALLVALVKSAGHPEISDAIQKASDKLTVPALDNAKIVPGLMAVNKVCPR